MVGTLKQNVRFSRGTVEYSEILYKRKSSGFFCVVQLFVGDHRGAGRRSALTTAQVISMVEAPWQQEECVCVLGGGGGGGGRGRATGVAVWGWCVKELRGVCGGGRYEGMRGVGGMWGVCGQ